MQTGGRPRLLITKPIIDHDIVLIDTLLPIAMECRCRVASAQRGCSNKRHKSDFDIFRAPAHPLSNRCDDDPCQPEQDGRKLDCRRDVPLLNLNLVIDGI